MRFWGVFEICYRAKFPWKKLQMAMRKKHQFVWEVFERSLRGTRSLKSPLEVLWRFPISPQDFLHCSLRLCSKSSEWSLKLFCISSFGTHQEFIWAFLWKFLKIPNESLSCFFKISEGSLGLKCLESCSEDLIQNQLSIQIDRVFTCWP